MTGPWPPLKKIKDKGGNPCWTVDWNWSQPAAETANEGILLKGSKDLFMSFIPVRQKINHSDPNLSLSIFPD